MHEQSRLDNVFLHVLPWASLDQTSFTAGTYVTTLANDELSARSDEPATRVFRRQSYQKEPQRLAAPRTSTALLTRAAAAEQRSQQQRHTRSPTTKCILSPLLRGLGYRGCLFLSSNNKRQVINCQNPSEVLPRVNDHFMNQLFCQ